METLDITNSVTSTHAVDYQNDSTIDNKRDNFGEEKLLPERSTRYPNPNVPEFYPKSAPLNDNQVNTTVETTQTTVKSNPLTVTKSSQFIKNNKTENCNDGQIELIRTNQRAYRPEYFSTFSQLEFPFYKPRLYYFDANKNLPNNKESPVNYIQFPSASAATFVHAYNFNVQRTIEQLQNEVNAKNKQLAHLNNIIIALLEEISKINEKSVKAESKNECQKNMNFAVNEFLQPSLQLRFYCNDCCVKFKDFVLNVCQQQDRKISLQYDQFKNKFIDRIMATVEKSLQTLSPQPVATYVNNAFYSTMQNGEQNNYCFQNYPTFENNTAIRSNYLQKIKSQPTKVYRNQNLQKPDTLSSSLYNLTQHLNIQQSRPPHNSGSNNQQPRIISNRQNKSPTDMNSFANPVHLVQNMFENLCYKQEKIVDKNLFKFSYIINGIEYSAVAPTKKEARYHSAVHVLQARKYNILQS